VKPTSVGLPAMKYTQPCLLFACLQAPLLAQSFAELTEQRNGVRPFAKLFQIEAGAIGVTPDDGDESRGLDHEISWDGRLYYRDEAFSSRRGTLEAYAGRDGLFAGFQDGKMVGDDTITRFELRARPWMFYRDGFYRDDELVPNGFYDGEDYEGYVGFGREAQPGLYVELGPYYRKLDFQRSALTPVTFTVPDGFSAYGGRLYIEQSTVQYDRRRGMPRDGYVLSLTGEREWNDSDDPFGTDGFQTRLPSAVWRARGRLDWYIPASDETCWEIFANGGWHDEKDRLQNTEGQRPLGNQWADAQLRLRLHLGESLTLTPYVQAQYSRLLKEDGFGSTKDFFLGGGVESWLHFSEAVSLNASWSWLDNENRPSIRIDEDVHGQQMFYVGMVLRLGAQRR
jgi:hypothetical protein